VVKPPDRQEQRVRTAQRDRSEIGARSRQLFAEALPFEDEVQLGSRSIAELRLKSAALSLDLVQI
jgi:hypothetical protein